jgi:hypothetical protein
MKIDFLMDSYNALLTARMNINTLFDESIETVIDNLPDDIKDKLLYKLLERFAKGRLYSKVDIYEKYGIIKDVRNIDDYVEYKLKIPIHDFINKYNLQDKDIYIKPVTDNDEKSVTLILIPDRDFITSVQNGDIHGWKFPVRLRQYLFCPKISD